MKKVRKKHSVKHSKNQKHTKQKRDNNLFFIGIKQQQYTVLNGNQL